MVSIFQSDVLEAQGFLNDQTTSVEIQGKWYEPGPAFNKSLRQVALEFCGDTGSRGLQYILIEFPSYLMAWRCIGSTKPGQLSPVPTSKAEEVSSISLGTIEKALGTHDSPQQSVHPPPPDIVSHQALGIANIDDEFTSKCKEELALHIGPMAEIVTKQTLSPSFELTPQELIEALAKHISDSSAALSFRKACYSNTGIKLL